MFEGLVGGLDRKKRVRRWRGQTAREGGGRPGGGGGGPEGGGGGGRGGFPASCAFASDGVHLLDSLRSRVYVT